MDWGVLSPDREARTVKPYGCGRRDRASEPVPASHVHNESLPRKTLMTGRRADPHRRVARQGMDDPRVARARWRSHSDNRTPSVPVSLPGGDSCRPAGGLPSRPPHLEERISDAAARRPRA